MIPKVNEVNALFRLALYTVDIEELTILIVNALVF
jgi:hypothetical protein